MACISYASMRSIAARSMACGCCANDGIKPKDKAEIENCPCRSGLPAMRHGEHPGWGPPKYKLPDGSIVRQLFQAFTSRISDQNSSHSSPAAAAGLLGASALGCVEAGALCAVLRTAGKARLAGIAATGAGAGFSAGADTDRSSMKVATSMDSAA